MSKVRKIHEHKQENKDFQTSAETFAILNAGRTFSQFRKCRHSADFEVLAGSRQLLAADFNGCSRFQMIFIGCSRFQTIRQMSTFGRFRRFRRLPATPTSSTTGPPHLSPIGPELAAIEPGEPPGQSWDLANVPAGASQPV